MNNEMARIGTEGLTFFSRTNRLISHELKNVLAIISETLGLIEELSAMAKEGADLPPGKIEALSESILEEIQRANRIVRGMNAFAHQVDQFLEEIDLTQSVPVITELAGLDANVKKITFQFGAADPCPVYTSPFFLNALIFRLIRSYAGQAAPDATVRIDFTADQTTAGIVFSGLQPELLGEVPTAGQQFLADLLQARLTVAEKEPHLSINIPISLTKSALEAFR